MDKKFLLLAYFDIFSVGGMATSLHRILKKLSEKGWRGVIINDICKEEHKKYVRIYSFEVVHIYPLTPQWLSIKKPFLIFKFWLKNIARTLKTIEYVNKENINLLFIWGPPNFPTIGFPNILPFWALLKKMKNLKIVIRVCGGGSSWMPISALRKLFYLEEIAQIKISDAFVCIEHFLYKHHYPKKYQPKGVVITNSVDTNIFYPMYKEEKNIVLYVGNLTSERGIWTFMRGIRYLKSKNYKYMVIGSGDAEKRVKKYAKKEGLNIKFIPAVAHSKMPFYYNIATIVVNPTPMESIGNITLEGMACGKCVIKNKNIYEDLPIIDRVNGLIFARNSPEDLAKKIVYAMENPELRKELSENALQTIKRDYTVEKEATKYDYLLTKILMQ